MGVALQGIPELKAVAFDLGHTLMDEVKDADVWIESRSVHLMPDVFEVLPRIGMPMAIWANTHTARESDVRHWLQRAHLAELFMWIVTSVDAGFRKPAPQFFEFALARCGLTKDQVLFVGNQLNTDVRGGEGFGIRTVWVSGPEYHSDDDGESDGVSPSYTISRLGELPSLLQRIQGASPP